MLTGWKRGSVVGNNQINLPALLTAVAPLLLSLFPLLFSHSGRRKAGYREPFPSPAYPTSYTASRFSPYKGFRGPLIPSLEVVAVTGWLAGDRWWVPGQLGRPLLGRGAYCCGVDCPIAKGAAGENRGACGQE